LRCVLIDTPCVTGFRKTADLTHASHLADVKQSPTSDNYLLHCVAACAREALRELLKHGDKLTPLAAEIALKMCRWHKETVQSPKALLLEFVDALICLSSNAKTLGEVEAPRVSTAAALICRRWDCSRKAAALVAIAASSCSVLGNYRGAAGLWYLSCSFTSAWNILPNKLNSSHLAGSKIKAWSLICATSLKQLASCAEINGDKESALRAWVQFLHLQCKIQTHDMYRSFTQSRAKCVLLHQVQDANGLKVTQTSAAAQYNAFGHLVKCARETPCWQQIYKFPLMLDFESFRAPYFANVNNCNANYQTNKNVCVVSNKQSTLFFDPRKTPINKVHMSHGANWVEGERHSVALRVKNPLGANVSFISAYLELRGSECIVHEHLFDKVVLNGRSSAPILLDATPILQENAIKLSGAWITMMDDNGDSFSSFHSIEITCPASRQKKERIFKFNST